MNETLASLSDEELDVFVNAALDFFKVSCREAVEIGEASIVIDELPTLDYTGLIEVTGLEKGFVYLTASKPAVERLMQTMTGELADEELYEDLIGEVVSIIVSNTRRHFGSRLHVSVPKIFAKGESLPQAETIGFTLPLIFQRESLLLVLAIYPSE